MKRTSLAFLVVLLLLLLDSYQVVAQREPVTWLISVDSINRDRGTLVFQAKILKGWHLYSQHMQEGGPMPTSFAYANSDYRTIGDTHENGKRTVYHDDIYDMEVAWYADEVTFSQRIQLLKQDIFVKGSIEYMVCNGDVCMPAKKPFSVPTAKR